MEGSEVSFLSSPQHCPPSDAPVGTDSDRECGVLSLIPPLPESITP